MKTIDWRTSYLDYGNINVTALAKYMSISGRKEGTGTREDPYNPTKQITGNSTTKSVLIIGNGKTEVTSVGNYNFEVIGQGKTSSILSNITFNNAAQLSGYTIYLSSLNIVSINSIKIWGRATTMKIKDCIFNDLIKQPNDLTNTNSGTLISNSIFIKKTMVAAADKSIIASNCTFYQCSTDVDIFKTATPLLVNCEVAINQLILDTYYTKYIAFNACKFRIGTEPTATALAGNNADELHNDFVTRCATQGLTLKTTNDDETNSPVDRWIFSKDSISGEYNTIKDSEIDIFAHKKGIYLGHTSTTVQQIPITTTPNIPASFTNIPQVCSETLVQNGSIGLLSSSDFTKRINAYADSKIIWLGGLSKLTQLALTHNLPTDAGVSPDSVCGIAAESNKQIKVGNHYIVRSNDDSLATIKYNNVEYTSSLITRKNVFLGVAGITAFDDLSGNATVYQVLDFANHSSIQIRLMREIPTGNITSGSLQAGYWYFVEPNSLSDTSGSVTYKGIVRPAFDSFLVDAANLTFSGLNKVHLRRCWKQDFDFATETTDKSFWNGRQKPNYYDVVADDLRCLLKNNSSASVELASDGGTYIGSGHPDFYNWVNGVNGLKLPSYDIVGTYLQIRVPITTINPM